MGRNLDYVWPKTDTARLMRAVSVSLSFFQFLGVKIGSGVGLDFPFSIKIEFISG